MILEEQVICDRLEKKIELGRPERHAMSVYRFIRRKNDSP